MVGGTQLVWPVWQPHHCDLSLSAVQALSAMCACSAGSEDVLGLICLAAQMAFEVDFLLPDRGSQC